VKASLPIALLIGVWSAHAHALCSADISISDVDGVAGPLGARSTEWSGSDSALQMMVHEGVIEQIGQLQVVKLLIGLRESVTGRDNQAKVRDALRAILHTVADNAAALRELASKSAPTDSRTTLVADLDREIALVRCDDPGKKEAPGAGGR